MWQAHACRLVCTGQQRIRLRASTPSPVPSQVCTHRQLVSASRRRRVVRRVGGAHTQRQAVDAVVMSSHAQRRQADDGRSQARAQRRGVVSIVGVAKHQWCRRRRANSGTCRRQDALGGRGRGCRAFCGQLGLEGLGGRQPAGGRAARARRGGLCEHCTVIASTRLHASRPGSARKKAPRNACMNPPPHLCHAQTALSVAPGASDRSLAVLPLVSACSSASTAVEVASWRLHVRLRPLSSEKVRLE